ncbi:MAG TPA: CHASE3 domain-containing protein, partial [Thermoanaerobaculia bacterium]
MTIAVVQIERRQEYEIIHSSLPLSDSLRNMDEALQTMVSAARGYQLTDQTAFIQQYDDAVRAWDKAAQRARELSLGTRDQRTVTDFIAHFKDIKGLTDEQIRLAHDGKLDPAKERAVDIARLRREAPDFAGILSDQHRAEQSAAFERATSTRQWIVTMILLGGLLIVGAAAVAVWRIEQLLRESIARQVKRTEAMIGGMTDGVMLVDGEGRAVFINPAGQKLLAKSSLNVPIFRHS